MCIVRVVFRKSNDTLKNMVFNNIIDLNREMTTNFNTTWCDFTNHMLYIYIFMTNKFALTFIHVNKIYVWLQTLSHKYQWAISFLIKKDLAVAQRD